VLGIVLSGKSGEAMRTQVVVALAMLATLTACGMLGGDKPEKPTLDNGGLVSKPLGPGLVSRCPVPADYDDATLKKIQAALEALPPDNILQQVMKDYETERDNLRMCQ
jgi:hypothetical protein